MQPRKVQKTDLKLQVKDELLRFIKSMDLSVNRKLPREEQMSEMMGVSRITLRSVLDDMATEGIIFRKQGKGTFVNPSFFEMKVSFNPVMHFSDMITNSGYVPRTEFIYREVQKANEEIASMLGIKPNEDVLVCAKVFYADNQLCAMTEDYVAVSYLKTNDFKFLEMYQDSLFYFIYRTCGHKVMWDKVEIGAVYSKDVERLDEQLRRHNVTAKPYLLLRGINYDEEDQAAFYSLEYVDTQILKFNQIRKRIIHFDEVDEKRRDDV